MALPLLLLPLLLLDHAQQTVANPPQNSPEVGTWFDILWSQGRNQDMGFLATIRGNRGSCLGGSDAKIAKNKWQSFIR